MSEQHVQPQEQEQRSFQLPTKEQALAVGGTLLASGLVDYGTHNIGFAIAGLVAAYAVGKLTPEVARALYPGSDPDATIAATQAIAEHIAPMASHKDRPQDAMSKIRRLLNLKSSDAPGTPKDERPAAPVPPAAVASSKKPTPDVQPLAIPPVFLIDDMIETVRALNEQGYVYFGRGGIDPAVKLPLKSMYHVFDVSSSGSGKSNRFRLAMMQLVDYCEVYYINPFANKIKVVDDSRQVEVWSPIFERLANGRPMKSAADIEQLTQALVDEIQTRIDQEEQDDFSWRNYPIFVFVDELPEVNNRCKDAIAKLDTIVRTGRQFGVFAYVASQSGAVQDIGQSEATQAQYRTRLYGGGDSRSASKLMKGPVAAQEEEALLSTQNGLTLMLAEGISRRQFVRSPLVSNEALFAYFGLEFNLADWLPAAQPSSTRRSNVARSINEPGAVARSRQEEKQRPVPIQPVAVQPLTFDEVMRAFLDGRIDDAKLYALCKLLPDSPATQAGKSGHTNLSSECEIEASPKTGTGNIPDATKDAVNQPVVLIPTLPDLSPKRPVLGKDDKPFSPEQEEDFLRRYKKTPNVGDCLEHMPNAKGGIGLSNHYYKYANWLAKQQQK